MTEEQAKERIRLLGIVGNALSQVTNERREDTEYFLALESLTKFRKLILELQLDFSTIEGMNNLLNYLEKKIKKRMTQSKI